MIVGGILFMAVIVLEVAANCNELNDADDVMKCRMENVVKKFKNGEGGTVCSFKIPGFGSNNMKTAVEQFSFISKDKKLKYKVTLKNFAPAAVAGKAYEKEIKEGSKVHIYAESTITAFQYGATGGTNTKAEWKVLPMETELTNVVLEVPNLLKQPGAERTLSKGANTELLKDFEAGIIDFSGHCLLPAIQA